MQFQYTTLCFVLIFSCWRVDLNAQTPTSKVKLDGAFIQLDSDNRNWPKDRWQAELEKMRQVKIPMIIVQYMQTGEQCSTTPEENYLASATNPLRWILEEADAHGMSVFLGLRFDKKLLDSCFLSNPTDLQARLQSELSRNITLATTLVKTYDLKTRPSFGGWYLPVEIANFSDVQEGSLEGWVFQLSKFTGELVRFCKSQVNKPVAVSPYFNGRFECEGRGDLVAPDIMGKNYARYLRDAGIDIVMLQDGVGVGKLPTADVERYVRPYMLAIAEACKDAAAEGSSIEFWLNVESIGANMDRLTRQMEVGRGVAKRAVTFDFPHHLNTSPLIEEYMQYISTETSKP